METTNDPVYAWDAVFAFAHAAHNIIKSGGDTTNGAEILSELHRLSFIGASGNVSFTAVGDRSACPWLATNLFDGKETNVGVMDEVNGVSTYTDLAPIRFADGTSNVPILAISDDGKFAPHFCCC
jgi:hypothetical protein